MNLINELYNFANGMYQVMTTVAGPAPDADSKNQLTVIGEKPQAPVMSVPQAPPNPGL